MESFNSDLFVRTLLAETLFYDEEYGALGWLSLVDSSSLREEYLAAFDPDEGVFVVEEATEWESFDEDGEDEIGYALASEKSEHGRYDTPEAAAEVLLLLATERNLLPSLTILFEEDEVA